MGFNSSFISPSSGSLALASDSPAELASIDSITLFVALLCSCIVIGHLLEKNRWLNESITTLAIGMGTGIIILLTSGGKSSRILVFNEEFFFIYLLPQIIFNAGFQVKKKHFFQNFVTIVLFGVIGTLISFGIIALGARRLFQGLNIGFLELKDYLALGAIFSATDSVCTLQVLNQEETPLLYSLVFGEGVVNDATSIVLFNAIQKFDLSDINSIFALQFFGNFLYLFMMSTLLGVIVGLLSAYIIKKLYFGRHSTDREVALMMLMAYLSYMTAQMFNLSGILTIFFCGIVMSHYTWHNVTEESQITTKHSFATLSSVSEILIFLYVGMDALDIEKWRFVKDSPGTSVVVSSMLLGLILIGRACFVFPLSFLSNLTRKSKSEKVGFKQQVTVWWAGLMRGAVSVALAYSQFTNYGRTQQQGNATMITSTISVVLFSTVVFGLLTKPLKRFLLPHPMSLGHSDPSSPKAYLLPLLSIGQHPEESDMENPNLSTTTSLQMLFSSPTNTVHYYWRKFDDAYMRPVFGGRGFISNHNDPLVEDNVLR